KIGDAEADKEKDVDYLSSIEGLVLVCYHLSYKVLIVDHADVIAMQNWSHVNTVVEQLNCIPSKQHGTDIMRIRPCCLMHRYLDGQARFYRQTIILGSHVKLLCEHKGVLPKVLLQVRQIFERIDTESIVDADDARLDYFKNKVYPKIKDSVQGGIMIFISSYFEFVRVRNFLKSEDASMRLLGDYRSKEDDVAKICTSIYVTNFPGTFSAKDLFNSCKVYGHVVDSFIPFKKSKAGKRFRFVRFINVFNEERLDDGSNRNSSYVSKTDDGFKDAVKSNVHVVTGNSHYGTLENESKPAIVLDDDCLLNKFLGNSILGRVKEFASLSNLRMALVNEGFDNFKL
nr:U3 small nucleolar RNA-associated protein 25 isoform X1 [Tanacetum cinerariifolium]